MPRSLDVAMVDVGGTLWPNSWPFRETDRDGRRIRVSAALAGFDPALVDALVTDLVESSRSGDLARAVSTETAVAMTAEVLISSCLARQGLPSEPDTVARIRRAMALPVSDRMQPLPGAVELLEEIHALGMRTVIASNTYWRDAGSYWDDFRQLGMAEFIDEVVTSVDAGRAKPHPAVFEAAMRWAGVSAERCVVIGNREENDVEPALGLGMRAILVYPDDPPPSTTRADAVAADLWECARVLREMVG